VAEAFMKENPGIIVVVAAGGTARGIKAVIDGTVEIGVTSSEIDSENEKIAAERGIRLVSTVVGRGAVVPLVHPSNPVGDLSILQLRKIFSGQIANWKDVGGRDTPIQVVTNEFTRGSYNTWRRCVLGKSLMVSSQAITLEPLPLKKYVAENPNAIGYLSFTDGDETVKAIAVDGVKANLETIKNVSFPVRRDHMLVTREIVSETARRFIDFFLSPQKGQKFVAKHGISPAK